MIFCETAYGFFVFLTSPFLTRFAVLFRDSSFTLGSFLRNHFQSLSLVTLGSIGVIQICTSYPRLMVVVTLISGLYILPSTLVAVTSISGFLPSTLIARFLASFL